MKKHPIFIAVLSAFIVLSAFVGCSDQVVFPISVVSAEIVQEKDMLVGQDFDASNFIVRATYNDGSTRDLRGIVEFKGSTVANGSELSANAGRDMYGDDYYVYGYINAYELTGLEVTGPATINTESQNSVTVKPEDLTVTAKYAVKGETRTMKLAPVADYTVSSVSIDDGVTLDTSKTDAAATATVTTTFQTESDYATADYAFTAHYTGSAEPVVPGDYAWYDHKLAYSVADGIYYQRGLFGDGSDIVTVYKVMTPDGEAAADSDVMFEEITDTENLEITLDAYLDGSDNTRFATAESATISSITYTYVENEAGMYEKASDVIGAVVDGKIVSSGNAIKLYSDYLKDLTITLVDPEKDYYVNDSLTGTDFKVLPVWASGYNSDVEVVYTTGSTTPNRYTLSSTTVPVNGKLTFTYVGSDNAAYTSYVDGISSVEYTLKALDYPESITATLKDDMVVYTNQSYSVDLFDFEVVWVSGNTYEDTAAPEVEITLDSQRTIAGSSAENVYFNWSCNGKQNSTSEKISTVVTPVADEPAEISAVQNPDAVVTENSGIFPAFFNFTVTWKSGYDYTVEGANEAPEINYTFNPRNTGAYNVKTPVTIGWTCGDATGTIESEITANTARQ